jgi:lysophospholipase L1-like esterase
MITRLLEPIALLQGFWLLRFTPRLPSPVGNGGLFGGHAGSPLRVVGVGDSVIAGTGVRDQRNALTAALSRLLHQRLRRGVEWRVHGENGATSVGVLHKLAPLAPTAHVYLVSVGVNDATHNVEPHRFEQNLDETFALLRRKSPEATILYGGLPPLEHFPAMPWPLGKILAHRARELQGRACEVAARHARVRCFQFPDTVPADQFASDGFHPAESACASWARGLLDLLSLGEWSGAGSSDRKLLSSKPRAVRGGTAARPTPTLPPRGPATQRG